MSVEVVLEVVHSVKHVSVLLFCRAFLKDRVVLDIVGGLVESLDGNQMQIVFDWDSLIKLLVSADGSHLPAYARASGRCSRS